MRLTELRTKYAKATDKPLKISDGGGLFLLVQPNSLKADKKDKRVIKHGAKYWRLAYRFDGKQKTLALGVYPTVSLDVARERREEARKLLADGIDPSDTKKAQKTAIQTKEVNSFEIVAREWLKRKEPKWKTNHSNKIISWLEKDIFPWLGEYPVNEITELELLKTIRRIESRGALQTAHRVLAYCGQIFRYAITTGRAQHNIAADLRGVLPPVKEVHHASITDPKLVGKLLRNIDNYHGNFITRCALQLVPLVFVHLSELRRAEWAEIDFDKAEWRIPAEHMKMKVAHIVPLSTQAIEILREIYPLTGTGKYVFPGARSTTRPMSDNTVLGALRRMGYTNEVMAGHGFRIMASTLLKEQSWNRGVIERQLAHGEHNSVRTTAYNYTEYLPERGKMMQGWADYLDKLKSSK